MNKHVKSFGVIIGLGLLVMLVAIIWSTLKVGQFNDQSQVQVPNANQNQNPAQNSAQNPGQDPAPAAVVVPANLVNGQTVTLPMTVTGTVPGNWFFEGSFPVIMKDANGNQIGVALAQSSEDWMTTNIIPFSVMLPVTNYQGPGTITFKKDNPSGEPQFDAEMVVNVVF